MFNQLRCKSSAISKSDLPAIARSRMFARLIFLAPGQSFWVRTTNSTFSPSPNLRRISSPSPSPTWRLTNFNYQNYFDVVFVQRGEYQGIYYPSLYDKVV